MSKRPPRVSHLKMPDYPHTSDPYLQAATRALSMIPPDLLNMVPVHIEQIATALGVRQIISSGIESDGILQPSDEKTFTIFTNKNQSAQRQRFSCAHEVAHILLNPQYGRSISKRHGRTSKEQLEVACDRLASELLMPHDLFSEHASSFSWRFSSIPSLANTFQTSIQATARRYVELINEPCALFVWRLGEHNGKNSIKLSALHKNRLVKNRLFEIGGDVQQVNSMLLTSSVGTIKRPGRHQRIRVSQGGRQSFDTILVETLVYGSGPKRRVMNTVYPERRAPSLLKRHWTNGLNASTAAIPSGGSGCG